jgi:hypothetical protein
MSPVPRKLTGKEFEALLLDAARREEKAGRLTMDRYGVEVSNFGGKLIAVPSKPDFEGAIAGGGQFIIEAKANSQPSFQIYPTVIKPRQIRHMVSRSRMGVPCFLIIHWNERILKNAVQPAFTVALPVLHTDTRWTDYIAACAEAKRTKAKLQPQGSISRDESLGIGTRVMWSIPPRCRNAMPDIGSLLIPDIAPETPEPIQTTLFNDIQPYELQQSHHRRTPHGRPGATLHPKR